MLTIKEVLHLALICPQNPDTGTCGQTITLSLQLQDRTNDLGTVTYNIPLGAPRPVCNTSCSQARLVTTQTLTRNGNDVVAAITVQNQGITQADAVTMTQAMLGAVNGTPLQVLGNIPGVLPPVLP